MEYILIDNSEFPEMSKEDIKLLFSEYDEVIFMGEPIPIALKNDWIKKGEYFGYPKCCIEQFIEKGWDSNSKEAIEISNNNGFIPCDNHVDQIKKGLITIDSLIQNRICETHFPID